MTGPLITNLDPYLSRDCVVLKKGDSIPVKASAALAASGWRGGQFARWVDDGTGEPCLGMADGRSCGYFVFGSDEDGDQYTSMTRQNSRYRYAVLFYGNSIIATNRFEQYTYVSRNGVGPLVPLTYKLNGSLYVSENGLLTTQDESDPAVNPGGLFPDGTAITERFSPVGLCALPAASQPKGYLFVQML